MVDLYDKFNILRYDNGKKKEIEDDIIKEFPLQIMVNDKNVVTLVCSPQYMKDLAVGYLFTEGFIDKNDFEVKKTVENRINVITAKKKEGIELAHRIITSGCGKSTIFTELDGRKIKKVRSRVKVSVDNVFAAVKKLYQESKLFQKTGGVHNSLIKDCYSDELIFREDIGRHNTVDKLVGNLIIKNKKVENKLLVISGRISAEILLKTARTGIPILASPSAPTDRAVQLARRLGITLLGFVRGSRLNIYAGEQRINF
ncbi:MAG: formate dehydrogenase accessory sulfurtransferase FdhD [Halanaerobiales bacterium]